MPATQTPLRYPGGKSKYASLFADVISMNHLEGCTFVEVFAGGAGAAVSLLLQDKVDSLMLNDLDVAIYSFWKSVMENPEELIKLIHDTRVSIEEWHYQRSIYEAKDPEDELSLGFATFFLNRCNYAGILGARPIGGIRQEGEYSLTSRYNKKTSIEKIRKLARVAASIEVFNLDGEAFLELLAAQPREANLLVYLDPPYYQKGPELYLNHLDHEDHLRLRDAILEFPHPWILSYDNSKEIVELYDNQECALYRNQLRHTVSGNSIARELIISRLRVPGHLSLIQAGGGGIKSVGD